MVNNLQPVSWEGEEYIVKEHTAWWYVGLVLITAALITLAVFFKGWTFIALIIVSDITILVLSLRPARKIHYTRDDKGLTEEKTLHKYSEFRAFGILQEGKHYSAILIPKKRLGLQVKVYFPEKNGEVIVDHLGNHLPMEEVKLDVIDKIVRALRI